MVKRLKLKSIKKSPTAEASRVRGGPLRDAGPVPESDLTTYSIRLNGPDRALLERVLTAKGWTPTQFIRQATLERAAQVENTRQYVKFDFPGLARRIAQHLCDSIVKTRPRHGPDDIWVDPDGLDALGQDFDFTTEPNPMRSSDVDRLRQAAALGGGEFFKMVVDECDRMTVQQRSDLPEPVDPSKLG